MMNRLRKFKKPAKWISFAILIVAILSSLFILLLPFFGWRVDTIYSGSMEPELGAGDMVISKPADPYEDIEVGDIIVFRPQEGATKVCHRVIDIGYIGKQPLFQTKGDANEDPNPYIVYPSYVASKVVFHIPKFGYFADFVKTTPGRIVTLVLPGVVIIGIELRNIWKTLSEMEKNKRSNPPSDEKSCV